MIETLRPTQFAIAAPNVTGAANAFDANPATFAAVVPTGGGTFAALDTFGFPNGSTGQNQRVSVRLRIRRRWSTQDTRDRSFVGVSINDGQSFQILDEQTVPNGWPSDPSDPAWREFPITGLVGAITFEHLRVRTQFSDGTPSTPPPPFYVDA